MIRTPALALFAAALLGPLPAHTAPKDPVTARLVSESAVLVPGTVARLGIVFEIEDGWHLFWDGCNDTGAPISVSPKLPEGYLAREVQWPAPERHVSPGGILDHIYEKQVMLILPVEVPRGLRAGSQVDLSCDLQWVRCREACVIGGGEVSLRLPVAREGRLGSDAQLFAAAEKRIPRPLDSADRSIRIAFSAGTLTVEADGADSLAFFPQAGCETLVDPLGQCAVRGGSLEIGYRPVDGHVGPVRGVLEVSRGAEPSRYLSVEVSTPPPELVKAPARSKGGT